MNAHRRPHRVAVGLVGLLVGVVAACGGTSGSNASSSTPKIGVVLTYNLPGFWSNYLSYEQKTESDQGVKLIGPDIANVEA
ncbi:MAG TPA: hypothetical protein VE953_11560, partial [Terriglobales bacterium]|nr:hypothetical protein [Terriglobales bacterium]